MTPVPTLHIAEDLDLPLEAVTEPIGLFANRGKGKSNAAHLFVEQLYHAGLPSIVLDVKGDWYGIRTAANGVDPGLPFLVLGGDRGDVALEPGSGRQWAALVVDQRIPTVVDMSHLSKTQARQWAMEFAEALYRANTEPLMLVVDEADVLIPQRLSAEMYRLLGAMEDIAKRGRQRGLGIMVISQRVADVNKSVTDLLETLFLFGVSGVRTRKALGEWIDDHAEPEEAKAVIATLSALDPGECWVWSPSWLKILQRFRWLRPETFDSHATPAPGQPRRPIRSVADVDLGAIKEAMAATIERAEAEDPKLLQARIRELEEAIAARPVLTEVKTVEVPVIPDELVARLEQLALPMEQISGDLLFLLRQHFLSRNAAEPTPVAPVGPAQPAAKVPRKSAEAPKVAPQPAPGGASSPPFSSAGSASLSKAEKAILGVLARFPAGRTKRALGIQAGYAPGGGGFNNALSSLRTAGLVERGDPVRPTAAGLAAGQGEPIPTGPALRQYWLDQLHNRKAERLILEALIEVYPRGRGKQDLADATGYVASGGGFNNALSRLRTLQLINGSSDSFTVVDSLFA